VMLPIKGRKFLIEIKFYLEKGPADNLSKIADNAENVAVHPVCGNALLGAALLPLTFIVLP